MHCILNYPTIKANANLNMIKSLEKKIKISNSSLLKEINYLGNSKNRIKEIINEILVKKNNREKI